jgi:hypothetical protein
LRPRRDETANAATALTCGLATTACADVQVEGTPAAVRVTTNQDTIADVLSAFGTNFNVKYRTAVPLSAASNGTYSGSLAQVVARLLDGYSYVIKKDQDTTEIVVFGRRGEAAIPPKAPPAPKGVLSRWRRRLAISLSAGAGL